MPRPLGRANPAPRRTRASRRGGAGALPRWLGPSSGAGPTSPLPRRRPAANHRRRRRRPPPVASSPGASGAPAVVPVNTGPVVLQETKEKQVAEAECVQHSKHSIQRQSKSETKQQYREQERKHTLTHARLEALRRSTITDNEIHVRVVFGRPPRALRVGVNATASPLWPQLALHDWPLLRARRRKRMARSSNPE